MKKDTKTYLIIACIMTLFTLFLVAVASGKVLYFFNNDPYIQSIERLAVSRQIEEVSDEVSEMPKSLDDSPALRTLETIENARITAYTTRAEEGTTCISASGVNLCYHYPPSFMKGFKIGDCRFGGYGLIACPSKYPFGTEIEIIGDDKDYNYICVDRMSPSHRDKDHFDIYMGRGEDRVYEARQWGECYLDVRVLE